MKELAIAESENSTRAATSAAALKRRRANRDFVVLKTTVAAEIGRERLVPPIPTKIPTKRTAAVSYTGFGAADVLKFRFAAANF